MSGKTMYGETPPLVRTEQERLDLIDRLAKDENHQFQVDRNSATWRAIKQEIERLTEMDYMSTLRNRNADHGRTQYARGAMDAFDCLLQFGGY